MKHSETSTEKKQRILRAKRIVKHLEELFPHADMQLSFQNNWELLVAVELSAQCTDKKVNEVTPALFHAYPTLNDYVQADPKEFEQYVFSTGFYHNKTKNILAAAKMVKEVFHGTIPKTMEEILRIPGVARKTANVVLGNAYGIILGIAVDTHVKRLANLFGLSDETDPNNIERDLCEIIPKEKWFHVTYLLIEYGRLYCPARHKHTDCPLRAEVVVQG